jgi:hypothetical protein
MKAWGDMKLSVFSVKNGRVKGKEKLEMAIN